MKHPVERVVVLVVAGAVLLWGIIYITPCSLVGVARRDVTPL